MYERKHEPVAPLPVFFQRLIGHVTLAIGILCFCLLIGLVGFHWLAGAAWIDAFHNSSMLLSGMGPVLVITTTGGKLFSSCYALFCGVVFITNIGVILAPLVHRIFHRLHFTA